MSGFEVTIEEEIADVTLGRPHVLLLGAGASKAALPHGDKHGRPVPLLKEVADQLKLVDYFPVDLTALSVQDFEAAYSRLHERGPSAELAAINAQVAEAFSQLELPDEPNLYDVINLSLRDKDVVATFNWDPFLLQSRLRLARLGLSTSFPQLFFLHGNVLAGFCETDSVSGMLGRRCSTCGRQFAPSKLLYPVEKKNYQSDPFIKREWEAVRYFLEECSMFTVFGYSAPVTDQEAVSLLKNGWGDTDQREMEQTEVIDRPGADHDALRATWQPFIHTHHYDIFDNFYDSFIANHPRRSIEAYWQQYFEAKFITNNPVPPRFLSFAEMGDWFRPLLEVEKHRAEESKSSERH